jgi:uncharacterized protein (TIGR02996 family)
MTDEKALLAAIWEESRDDAHRLVYADWLEENGDPAQVARGEFIRVQCELARLALGDPRFAALKARQKELWSKWKVAWRSALKGEAKRWPFQRGFPQPNDLGIYADELFRMTPARLAAAPARNCCLLDAARFFDDLLAWPGLERLETFYLSGAVPTGDWLGRVLACLAFRNVRRICLVSCPIELPQLEALLTAWQDHPIVEVTLNGSKIGDDGLGLVLNHPVIDTVRVIGISGCGLTAAGMRALAESHLRLSEDRFSPDWNAIRSAGLVELLRWPGLVHVEKLGLNRTQITDAGVVALAGCPAVSGLRGLWLGGNRVGATGAAALVASPHLGQLRELYLHDNPLPATAIQALRDRFGKRLQSYPGDDNDD